MYINIETVNEINRGFYVNDKSAFLFHYVHSPEIARDIRESGLMKPSRERPDSLLARMYNSSTKPHINLTDVKPEEGRIKISCETEIGIPEYINYGLELLVEKRRLIRAFEHLERCYQIFSEEPVPVKVVHIRDMRKIDKGYRIHRFIGKNNLPYGFYIPPHQIPKRR